MANNITNNYVKFYGKADICCYKVSLSGAKLSRALTTFSLCE